MYMLTYALGVNLTYSHSDGERQFREANAVRVSREEVEE